VVPSTHPHSRPSPLPISSDSSLLMSTINRVGGPSRLTDNFTAIFEVAASEYQRVTGKPLDAHPFATQFEKCDSPQSFSNVLRTQAQALGAPSKSNDKLELMAWLDPIIHILYTFSATLGEGIGIVSHVVLPVLPFFDVIRPSAVLTRQNNLHWYRCSSRRRSLFPTTLSRVCLILKSQAVRDIAADYDTLIHLFERIHFFLQRLDGYTGIPLTNEFTELLGKIMAQILSILAISTKVMAQRRISASLHIPNPLLC